MSDLRSRTYRSETDYWRIRQFLRDVFLLNERQELSWQPYRFDYWRRHGVVNLNAPPLERSVFLWETGDGQIAAVMHPESAGEVYLHVHPAYHSPALEEQMVAVAEEQLAVERDGRRRLRIWAQASDPLRQAILQRRGFIKSDWPEFARYRSVAAAGSVPESPLPAGFSVRALRGREELPARSFLSWRVFHPNEPDEDYEGGEWYLSIQLAPLYRRDLDIVAVAPDGTLASFCTVWFDDVTQAGAFEPVGTGPEYQRLGLGKAVMAEGLRRLAQRGAVKAFVGSYNEPAHKLYSSMGFTKYLLIEPWLKEF